jgi:hypothetical protein
MSLVQNPGQVKLVPGLKRRRSSIEVSPGLRERSWCYVLPTLAKCRDAFEQEINQSIEWGEEEA